jgi:NAD-dependent deacetylase
MAEAGQSAIRDVAQWLVQSRRAVVFTGAGMSTESGIPDFRSPGGVWSKYKLVYYHEFLASAEARNEYWRQKSEAADDFQRARPNAGHLTIARWEHAGRVAGVITQNIDGLHQMAGSRVVHELHGTARQVECVDCDERFEPWPILLEYRARQAVPPCPGCGGRLKSATVLFGQPMPAQAMRDSVALAESCDLFLAIGSSLVVYPAAGLPEIASRSGARLVIINRDPTDQDASADAVIHEPIGETLTRIDEAMAGAAQRTAGR